MNPTPSLLAAIAAGDLASVPILADALEEAGRARAARLLRRRHRMWERRRRTAAEEVRRCDRAITRQWDELVKTVQALGGTAMVDVRVSCESILHEDALLREYVARLARSEGLA